jgi:hypothetical protein
MCVGHSCHLLYDESKVLLDQIQRQHSSQAILGITRDQLHYMRAIL